MRHNEEQKYASAQNNEMEEAKELEDLQVAETLKETVEIDTPKYLKFRRLVDFHLQSLRNQQIDDKEKLLPLIGQTKLLFKATNDGFKASIFHQKCDNNGPTISIILSEHGEVFGGYTSLPWSSSKQYKPNKDINTFVFSLNITNFIQ
ncbi:UNKNOWN [Stylonychia lemnae]|uniref:TLDc domain-containing protein n=1 Tax=Stylonychia lemnae TaxID=5949 RepID=A0A078AGC2_STYLE|nr:UNKNOWN [Stylonychia lemnae]|eukprot:CDW81350.1 UNKNOWN [Stylonychia lemnae]